MMLGSFRTWILTLPLAVACLVNPTVCPAQAPAPRAAAAPVEDSGIRARLELFLKAYNEKNPEALSELFREDATAVDATGETTRGKAAIIEQFREGFSAGAPYKIEAVVELSRVLTPDVVQLEGTSKLTAADMPEIANRFSVLMTKTNGNWLIAEMRDSPLPSEPIPPAERLAELEWMIGDWVDESPDAAIKSSITWGDNKAFIVRKYSIHVGDKQESGGVMIIAWDPGTAQIKSWVFDGAGGRAEGHWTRATDNQWIIKTHGQLADGSPTSATQVVTLVSKDAVKTGSFDQVVAGEVSAESVEVLMVRRPPAPGRQ